WTRWWWLGNRVDEAESRRQVAMFVEKGFGGVEIQAFSLGDRVDRRPGMRDRTLQFDTDAFWSNVRATLDAAKDAGLGVDLNHGSGWPAGGPWVGLADTYETLIYGETSIEGGSEGREVAQTLPGPHLPLGYELTLLLERVFGSEVVSFPVEHRRLVAVVAAREYEAASRSRAGYDAQRELVVRDGSETGRFQPVRDGAAAAGAQAPRGDAQTAKRAQVMLDPATLTVLDSNVRDGELRWSAPPGTWRVVAIYAMPAGEAPTLVAAPQAGLVLDHFHADKVRAHYDYLLGKRTGIDAYWGAPLRGFFNDSLEFKVERHWAEGFLDEFARRRGYDLRPWLPALFVAGADNFFVSDVFGVHPDPDFGLGAEADRVRWDYELTVSDLVIERFFDSSREWAAARGLLSRAQGYGMALDAIRAAGHIDIPETEALYAGGSDLFLKLASSGAHLYGRSLVSAESFVWRGAEYRTTPQKVRAAADKLFTAGVNHVVWHGTPYRVTRAEGDGFGEEGWYPWSIPGATLGFSTNFSEASPFWRDAEAINRYLARAQLLLRQGRPEADVLVYYPFARFPSSFGGDAEAAEREDLFNGWLREAEPAVPASSLAGLLGGRAESVEDPLVPWLREQQR
ncbi:MAG TPA: glycosyl hydrolase, partial [Thermoanaerobaculia bacterium]|nr:glycosyl hydrolase [Thermoanaerobaculia bacterium]